MGVERRGGGGCERREDPLGGVCDERRDEWLVGIEELQELVEVDFVCDLSTEKRVSGVVPANGASGEQRTRGRTGVSDLLSL